MMRSFPLFSGRRSMVLFVAGFLTCLVLTIGSLTAADKPAQPIDKDHAAKMTRGLALFKEQIRPLLTRRCLRCHGGKSTESEFDLHDRDGLLKGGLTGPAIVPGKSRDSLLF